MSYQPQWDHVSAQVQEAVEYVRSRFPSYWEELKVHGQSSRRFINQLSAYLREAGINCACNEKRGNEGLSIDVLAFPNPTGCPDAFGVHPGLELRDVVSGAEGPHPSAAFGDVTPATLAAGAKGGWVLPVTPKPTTPTTPTHVCPRPPSYDAMGGDALADQQIGRHLEADYRAAGQALNAGSSVWVARCYYDVLVAKTADPKADPAAIVTKHRHAWRAALGLPPL